MISHHHNEGPPVLLVWLGTVGTWVIDHVNQTNISFLLTCGVSTLALIHMIIKIKIDGKGFFKRKNKTNENDRG